MHLKFLPLLYNIVSPKELGRSQNVDLEVKEISNHIFLKISAKNIFEMEIEKKNGRKKNLTRQNFRKYFWIDIFEKYFQIWDFEKDFQI